MHRATRASHPTPGVSRREKMLEIARLVGANVLFTAFVLVVAYLLYYAYAEKRHETDLKRQEVAEAQLDLDRTLAVNQSLKRQSEFLRTEEGVEKVAREKLGLIKPHESTYVVVNGERPKDPSEADIGARVHPASPPPPPCKHNQLVRPFHVLWNGGD